MIYPAKVSNTVALARTNTAPTPPADQNPELRKAFDAFVGETFFSQMLKSLRQAQGKPAYFYGGRTEEIFQQQLDQVLAEKLSRSSADRFTGPMFELFTMQRR
jgi:flagellar protein FlgJ